MNLADRLIVSLQSPIEQVRQFAPSLRGFISTFLLEEYDSEMFEYLRNDLGFHVMVNTKLIGDPEKINEEIDKMLLNSPKMITVLARTGQASMKILRQRLIDTTPVAIIDTPVASNGAGQFPSSVCRVITNQAALAKQSGIQSLMCSPKIFRVLRSTKDFNDCQFFITGIWPSWVVLPTDPENTMSVQGAIKERVKYLIIDEQVFNQGSLKAEILKVLKRMDNVLKKVAEKDTATFDKEDIASYKQGQSV